MRGPKGSCPGRMPRYLDQVSQVCICCLAAIGHVDMFVKLVWPWSRPEACSSGQSSPALVFSFCMGVHGFLANPHRNPGHLVPHMVERLHSRTPRLTGQSWGGRLWRQGATACGPRVSRAFTTQVPRPGHAADLSPAINVRAVRNPH